MTEEEILTLIKADKWMMNVLQIAEMQNLKDWMIGAGFIRNKVWNYLHGYQNDVVQTHDVDLVYFDPQGNDEKADDLLSEKLRKETGINFEIVNEAYAHVWKNLQPYTSTEDAIAHWPETATSVAATSKNGELKLIAPYGVDDLVNLIVRMSPKFPEGVEVVEERIRNKKWLEKWPKIIVLK